MQQLHAEYNQYSAFLVGQSTGQTRPEATAGEMQQWEQEWQRMGGAGSSNPS